MSRKLALIGIAAAGLIAAQDALAEVPPSSWPPSGWVLLAPGSHYACKRNEAAVFNAPATDGTVYVGVRDAAACERKCNEAPWCLGFSFKLTVYPETGRSLGQCTILGSKDFPTVAFSPRNDFEYAVVCIRDHKDTSRLVDSYWRSDGFHHLRPPSAPGGSPGGRRYP